MSNHLGTHVDAPRHFFDQGETVDAIPASSWAFRNVRLINCPKAEGGRVTARDLQSLLPSDPQIEAILIRTGFELRRAEQVYWENNPGLGADLALWLRETFPRLRLVGVDVISISCFQRREEGREAHRAFLSPEGVGNPLLLVEDMRLSPLGDGARIDELIVAPLRIKDGDGAPCTVMARTSR